MGGSETVRKPDECIWLNTGFVDKFPVYIINHNKNGNQDDMNKSLSSTNLGSLDFFKSSYQKRCPETLSLPLKSAQADG